MERSAKKERGLQKKEKKALTGPTFLEMSEYATIHVVRQIVVHHIKRNSFSLAEVLRFGIACRFVDPRKCSQRTWTVPGRVSKKNLALRKTALESTLPPHNDGAGHRVSERIESSFHAQSEFL